MFKFIYFETSKEFEDWQLDKNINIFQFSPVTMKFNGTDGDGVVDLETTVGCFVVYQDK